MNKTLFVIIDNTPIPVEAENEIVPLDCKQINDFCSFAGDALIGDLKDKNGTPFYRLINPVGRLLSDFEKVDKVSYDKIIAQWLDILGEILHKGVAQCDEQFAIHFPQQYIDWLLCNENDYYVEIGKCLQSNDGKVFLDADGISEDIFSALHMKIRRFLNDNKDDVEYIVFSNERIGNSSYVIKQQKTVFDSYSFMRLEQWEQILQEEQQRRIENLEDVRAFWLDDLKIGVTTRADIPQSCKDYYKNFHLEFKKEGKLSRMWTQPNTEAVNILLPILLGEEKRWEEISYNSIFSNLKKKGFFVEKSPRFYETKKGEFYYDCELKKETETYICIISFWHCMGYSKNIEKSQEELGTLYRVSIELT